MASCPSSNMKLGNGFAPVRELTAAGVNVCLGTDGAASNNSLNIFRELGMITMIHKGAHKDALSVSADEALGFVTVNGARALGFVGAGVIAPGSPADLTLFRLDTPSFTPRTSLKSALCYSANGSEADTVMVGGEIIMENRTMTKADEEKLMIAKDHLFPKQLQRHGLKKAQVRLSDDAIREIITCYTRESGVRNLERELATLCRKCDMRFVGPKPPKRLTIQGANLEEYLGVRKFLPDPLPPVDSVGLVTGLAWTSVGGETLEVEVNVVNGSGKLELTGNLGDVMKESVYAAMSYIRSRTEALHLDPDFYKTKDIHVHFPEGAIPKDGPSAGITICTAMVSALTGARVRRDIAMTGEISIRGRVLPIGGLKEKTMAALRHGIKTVIIPEANAKDLEEIDQTVRKALNFLTVSHVDTVLEAALDFPTQEETSTPVQVPQEAQLAVTREQSKSRKTGIRQ